jgi:hypothetical protein
MSALPHDVLAEILRDLQRYGKPRLGIYGDDDRWNCVIEMRVSAPGAETKIRSDWVSDPLVAATQCRQRVLAVLDDLRKLLT